MPGPGLRHDLLACVSACGRGGCQRGPQRAHSAWLRRDGAWRRSRGTRCLAAGPAPPGSQVQPRRSDDPTQLPGGSCRAAPGAARRHRGLQTAGDAAPHGPAHIWFSFRCPNVITFSATQRKSLVRCGFPHFPSRLRNQSLSFRQPPCHPSVLLGKGHSRTLPFSRADGRGSVGTRSPPVPPERINS